MRFEYPVMKKVSNLYNMFRIRLQREKYYTTIEYWDSKASEYDDKSISLWPNSHLNELYHQEQVNFIEKSLGDLTGKKVLDLGCGMGRLSRHLAERGAHVVGVDFSATTIKVAQRYSTSGNPSYVHGSIFDIEAVSEYEAIIHSAVIAMACTRHEQVSDVLFRLRRAIKPGGLLVSIEPLHKGFLHRVLKMNSDQYESLLKKSGFKVNCLKQLHFWPTRLFLAYVKWPKIVTIPCYRFGQLLLAVPLFKRMGDYKAFVSEAR